MQANAPDRHRPLRESEATLRLYGVNQGPTDNYGRLCLMARRLCESGVRFVQVNYGDNSNNPAWDQHSNMPKHADHARAVDKPVAGLLADLKAARPAGGHPGLVGRRVRPHPVRREKRHRARPQSRRLQRLPGRRRIKPGLAFGETDEFGHQAVVDKVHMHDLHATILHQLGLDHERLTFRHDGRDYRLTDVHGHVVKDLLI
jgi:hypothetical protein